MQLLALADVLERVAGIFALAIPASELANDQREVDNAAVADTDVIWLGNLIDHIRDGLNTGTYEVLPLLDHDTAPASRVREPTPEETVMFDLMRFAGGESDVIWIDDRWAQSHEHRDGMRIVGTIDLLTWLRDAGTMSTADFAHALNDMRAADIRFVAFDADELVAALREAPIENGTLVETRTLRVLRQYYARCLIEADILRPPTGSDGAPKVTIEWNFLLGCSRAVTNAMVMVWDTSPSDHAAVQAEWLLRNMYTNDRGVHGTLQPRTEAKNTYLTTVSLADLIVASLRLDGQGSLRQARRDYLQWLFHHVIRGRFAADGDLARAVVEQLKEFITQAKDLITQVPQDLKDTLAQIPENADEVMEAMPFRVMSQFWSDLPNELRKLMEPDQEFLRTLGLSIQTVVSIGPLRVEQQRFCDTLSRVLKDRVSGELTTFDGHSVHIELVSDDPIQFSVRCDAVEFEGPIGGHELGFLSESFAEREASAVRLARWFDLPKSQRDELVATVVGGHDPTTRFELATEARKASGAELYQRLYDSIKEGDPFKPMDAMPADVSVLMNHLRISNADSALVQWMYSADKLVSDVGVVEAAQRLGGLPITLPKSFVTAVAALAPVERRWSLRMIRRIWLASPVGLVHLAQLWNQLPHVSRHAAKVRRRLARVLCSDGLRPTFKAWLTTLRWVDEQFGFNESARVLPREIRLALVWSHADRVFRILRSRGLAPEWIETAFDRHDYTVAPELVFPHTAYSEDVAAPRRLGAEVFVLSALTVICTDTVMEATVQTMWGRSLVGMSDRGRVALGQTMLTDTRHATNLLGSWLGNDRSWLSLFPKEIRRDYTFEAIDVAVGEACAGIIGKNYERNYEQRCWDQLGTVLNDEQRCWVRLRIILGDFPPSESTRLVVEDALLSADLLDYIQRDPMLATLVIDVMASQARHASEKTRTRIETQLLAVAAKAGDAELNAEMRESISRAILAGLVGCTWWELDGEARAASLARLFERLAESDSSPMFVSSGPFILGVCDALPVSQARHFWRVRDLLRLKSQS